MAGILALSLLTAAAPLRAQEPPAKPPQTQPTTTATQAVESQPATAAVAEPARPDALRSARATVRELLLAVTQSADKPERITDAVACLDLSGIPVEQRGEQAPRRAEQLAALIDDVFRLKGQTTEQLPDEPEGETFVLFEGEEDEPYAITLARGADGRWRFTAQTVLAIPQLQKSIRQAATTQPAPTKETESTVPLGIRSARATMDTFLKAVNAGNLDKAASCLDLSKLPAATRSEVGRRLARRLKEVIDRVEEVVIQDLPDDPDGSPYTFYVHEKGKIQIARFVVSGEEGRDREGHWLFTAATVGDIEDLFKALEEKERVAEVPAPSFRDDPALWLRSKIPSALKGEVFKIEYWQWLGLILVILLGELARRVASWILFPIVRRILRTEGSEVLPSIVGRWLRPMAALAMVSAWWGGLQLLDLHSDVIAVLWPPMKFLMAVAAVWACYRLIDLGMSKLAARAARTETRMDDVLVPLARKSLKVLIIAAGVTFVIKAVFPGLQLTTLLAGFGLGGLAIGLAAQDTLKNFFGSVNVVLDRPFQVGDWVKIGNTEGTVETVGLRSSKLRTFYNSQVTIPNSEIMNALVDNMGRRRFRRISCKLSVLYSTTPERLEAFCEGIRELIRTHPYTRRDYYHVYVNEFADSAVNILLYCFHETPDWSTELRERHRLFLDIIRLANRLGVEFAFPTQTVHLHHESSPPPESPTRPAPPPDAEGAMQFGRSQADAIVREAFGDEVMKPPPVEF